tara:strand:- start:164 stop:1192 length:1029 start_codon:yes stop_codon:yes gene_type:complete
MKLFKKRTENYYSKIYGPLAIVVAPIITGIFGVLIVLISTNNSSGTNSYSQSQAEKNVQNINTSTGTLIVNDVDSLEKMRHRGFEDGESHGVKKGIRIVKESNEQKLDKYLHLIPERVIEKMYPKKNGLTYLERLRLADESCFEGSLAKKDLCFLSILRGINNIKEYKTASQIVKENKTKEELKKRGIVEVVVNLRFKGDPTLEGDIADNIKLLRSMSEWYFLCNKETGCEILDLDKSLQLRLKHATKLERLVQGPALLPTDRFFENYILRTTALFFDGKLHDVTNDEKEILLRKACEKMFVSSSDNIPDFEASNDMMPKKTTPSNNSNAKEICVEDYNKSI